MRLLDRIKSCLPVSRAAHEAQLKKEQELLRITLVSRQKEIEAERLRKMEKLDELAARLMRVQWRPYETGTFGLQLNFSAEMMRTSYDPDHRKMIAEMIGRQVEREILQSHFIQ